MIGPYIQAVEAQIDWLKRTCSQSLEADVQVASAFHASPTTMVADRTGLHRHIKSADTYFMNRHFCELVDLAYQNVPLDLVFDISWMHSLRGFMFRERPFRFAQDGLLDIKFDVVTWYPRDESTVTVQWVGVIAEQLLDVDSDIAVTGQIDLRDGEILTDCVQRGSGAAKDLAPWLYCAFHVMAQRMAITVDQKVDRAVRRRAEKAGDVVPEIVKVITLRRMEEARTREAPHDVNWRWQWEVRGHWRNQFYPSENAHKPVFVEAYIKGPTDKPFKSPGLKLFAAIR